MLPSTSLYAAKRVVTPLGLSSGVMVPPLPGVSGMGAVERLDLALLVDRQHDGVGRRVHGEADTVFDRLGEGGIVGALEGADAMRPQAVGLPDARHRAG